jgi:methyl-accepting chemotaxis protein
MWVFAQGAEEEDMIGAMKLRYRIFLGYALTVLLFTVAAAAVYTSVRELEKLEREQDEMSALNMAIQNLETRSLGMQASARGLIIMKNEALMNRFRERETELRRLKDFLDKKIQDQKQRQIWTKLSEAQDRLTRLEEALVADVKEDKQEKAMELFKAGESVNMTSEVRSLIVAFQERQAELSNEAKSASSHAREVVYRVLIGGTFLVILLSIIVGLWTIRNANRLIGRTTNAISSSSKEIAATVTQHERIAVAQAAMVNETNVTVEELSASSRQCADQAATVVEVAQRASGLTSEGSSIVGDAIHGMTSLKENVGSVADQILRLSEQTGQIGNIATVVKDLAAQTNMPALNAAVEATRAGEHGKGFAVVASEVRKLADQSKKSAEEAYRIVSEIQKAGNSTIMVTEEGTKTVEEVSRIAGKVGDLFEALSVEAGRVYESAQQVVLNTRQQSSAINQIGEAMGNINASSKETAAGISQTKTGLHNLEEAARDLQQMV